MSNYYIMSNNQYNQEGQSEQPQYFVNPYPTGPVPTAPPVIIEQQISQEPRNITSNYPAINPSYNSKAITRIMTLEEYNKIYRIPHQNAPRRQRVIMVDELDYQRRREAEKKSGFWKGVAAFFCCLLCCCPGPTC